VVAENFESRFGVLNMPEEIIYPFTLDSLTIKSNVFRRTEHFTLHEKGKIGISSKYGIVIVEPRYDNLEGYNLEGKPFSIPKKGTNFLATFTVESNFGNKSNVFRAFPLK